VPIGEFWSNNDFSPVVVVEDDLRDWLRKQSPVPLSGRQREAVIAEMLRSGDNPPRNISWKEFCVKVRDQCNGWINKAKDKAALGYSLKQIQRAVKDLREI
jgi:hypothetical protein